MTARLREAPLEGDLDLRTLVKGRLPPPMPPPMLAPPACLPAEGLGGEAPQEADGRLLPPRITQNVNSELTPM